ncbi:hypothetical protein CA267_001945 [Alteromonas pelagimontana]|uniref:Uncharacterized protein n=1 Tax=Alteromonas pelagimontana TaxID=1858656 RepID=A0A6M4MBX2_9ALTE|nr:hypothetical protein [Alteromonas pelagimontana]QJR79646.1 hypothetical protein CA267_001945 [Alteromonas pelagimontana]
MKARLLKTTLRGFRGVSFPVEVDALYESFGHLFVSAPELIAVGADESYLDGFEAWHFSGGEYEIIEPSADEKLRERIGREYQTIPDALIGTRGNQSQLADLLNCSRHTILKFIADKAGENHWIRLINGTPRLFTATAGRKAA